MKFEVKLFKKLDDLVLADILRLEEKVFPKPLSKEKITKELSVKNNISIFVAYDKNQPIGYKIGFERSKRIYYSWIGGVAPDYRSKGIAKELMRKQHDFAQDLDYGIVCTQTENSFKSMIILNLNSGFDIRGTILSTGDDHITIVMEKSLKS